MVDFLDDNQQRAVMAGEGLVRVMAGAGTGKTTVLTKRIERLVKEGEQPQSILATTFTNKAAGEMRTRLSETISNSEKIGIRTIDSAALRICLRNPEAAGIKPKFLLVDDDEVDSLLKMSAHHVGIIYDGMDKKGVAEVVQELRKRINSWKANGLRPDMRQMDDWNEAWRYYNSSMSERNLLDFSDLVLFANDALANVDVCQKESGAIKWLLVDEFQDTNAAQLKFLELLSSVHGNIFVVGDPDQSIYSFRKAYPRIMERAPQLLTRAAEKNFTSVSLIINRRCTDEILKPAVLIVDYNERDEQKILNSGKKGDKVDVEAHATCSVEAEEVGREIFNLRQQGVGLNNIAILARNAHVLDAIVGKFPAMGIPYVLRGGLRFAEKTEVKDIMAYVKLAINLSHDLALHRIISRPTRGLGPNAANALVTLMRKENICAHESLMKLSQNKDFNINASYGASTLSNHLKTLASMQQQGASPSDVVEYIIGEIGYSAWAHEQKDAPKTLASSLMAILRIAENHTILTEFAIDSMLDSDAEMIDMEAVSLSTIHASKGLEWSHVFLVGLEDGVLPSKRALEESGNPDDMWDWRATGGMEEERRLLHVAMTRAKLKLYLSYVTNRRGMNSRASRMLHEAELKVVKPPVKMASSIANPKKGKVSSKKQAFW